MGMIGNLVRVTPDELKEILKDSSALESKVYPDDSDDADGLLDIDKSWEALFYLLTGCTVAEAENAKPPLSWALFSGQIVDEDQDMGYGPAHYVDADQVKQINRALEKITVDQLKQKYNGVEMNAAGIYPEVWTEAESLDYVIEYFTLLKDFYKSAETENSAVITFIS